VLARVTLEFTYSRSTDTDVQGPSSKLTCLHSLLVFLKFDIFTVCAQVLCSGFCGCIAEQPINEAVITVPSYFNQAERRAMSRAADAAGLRVLQLINDNTAGNSDSYIFASSFLPHVSVATTAVAQCVIIATANTTVCCVNRHAFLVLFCVQ